MCRSVGYNVISLKRIRIGNYNLPRDLKEGNIRIDMTLKMVIEELI
jgi:16S rRNA U516 pseudouridylate synthase RsuA-like enzyme